MELPPRAASCGNVRLYVSPNGEVQSVVDELGKRLAYEVSVSGQDESSAADAPEHVMLACPANTKLAPKIEKAMKPFYDDMLASVVFPNHRLPAGAAHPTGALYVLEAQAKPRKECFWPMNLQYGTGLSIVEIEPRLNEDGLMLTREYLSSPKVRAVMSALQEHLRAPADPDVQPGVVLGDALKSLERFTSAAYENDPLLRTYRSDWDALWQPCLSAEDYVAICVSDWQDVSKETKDSAGHAVGQKRWYVACRFNLPVEVADQLAVTRFVNADDDTWENLVSRKCYARAQEISVRCREMLIETVLDKLGMRKRLSCPQYTHTTWNVFDSQRVTLQSESGVQYGVTFYAGCAPTHRAQRGALVERGPSPEDGLLWIHGSPTASPGGLPWKMASVCNGIPADYAGTEAKWTKQTLKWLVDSGWDARNGFAKLELFSKI